MPNHVVNELWIPDDVARQKFFELIGCTEDNPQFDFNALIPYPKEFEEQDASAELFSMFSGNALKDESARRKAEQDHIKKYGTNKDGFNSGGYDWCLANWGTKWGAYDCWLESKPGEVKLVFRTAWSQPKPIIRKMHQMFPDMEFHLESFDGGGGWCAGMRFYPGDDDEIYEWSGEYHGNKGGWITNALVTRRSFYLLNGNRS